MPEKSPLNPSNLPFFNTILIIPAMPSGSYFADGDVMTSTLSIISAGKFSTDVVSPPEISADGFPFTKILTLLFPRKLTTPSISTLTEGMLLSTSSPVPPAGVDIWLTLNTFLSILFSIIGASSITSTASAIKTVDFNFNSPNSTLRFSLKDKLIS